MPKPNGYHLPRHVAIIMDGNGRWANHKSKIRLWGHREGAKRVDEIVTAAAEWGISYLTLYTFSTENWSRPDSEIRFLMRLLSQQLATMDKKLVANRISLKAIGQLERLPKRALEALNRVIQETNFDEPKMTLTLALSYGGREEILSGTKKLIHKVLRGELSIDSIDEQTFSQALYQPGVPNPDLLIRTGGEYRISNFLLWEIAYTELYVTKTLWPDFGQDDFKVALEDFSTRQRRFGKTGQQAQRLGASP